MFEKILLKFTRSESPIPKTKKTGDGTVRSKPNPTSKLEKVDATDAKS